MVLCHVAKPWCCCCCCRRCCAASLPSPEPCPTPASAAGPPTPPPPASPCALKLASAATRAPASYSSGPANAPRMRGLKGAVGPGLPCLGLLSGEHPSSSSAPSSTSSSSILVWEGTGVGLAKPKPSPLSSSGISRHDVGSSANQRVNQPLTCSKTSATVATTQRCVATFHSIPLLPVCLFSHPGHNPPPWPATHRTTPPQLTHLRPPCCQGPS